MKKINKKGFQLKHGLDIDVEEGWKKIIARQFGGSAGRGFSELIQNMIDSYPAGTDWSDRIAKITTTEKSIKIIDYGEGLSLKRLELITTMGGTDKELDKKTIGQFGIGFFSIFNPALKTSRVVVSTRCEGHSVELTFAVNDPEKPPVINIKVMNTVFKYSTCIEVFFNSGTAPEACLEAAKKSLTYYPCSVMLNGQPYSSIWDEARKSGAFMFSDEHADGFISFGYSYRSFFELTLLCKYEYISENSLAHLNATNGSYKGDLRDYLNHEMPYIPDIKIVINSNRLNVTISRDRFYLDASYTRMMGSLARASCAVLNDILQGEQVVSDGLILANQYIMANQIKNYLATYASQQKEPSEKENPKEVLIRLLANKRIFQLSGQRNKVSLMDIYRKRTTKWPLFFAPDQQNMNWLGGAFKRDFIVIPPKIDNYYAPTNLFDSMFEKIFGDVLNLDSVVDNQNKIAELVEREVVSREALKPEVKVIEGLAISNKESAFLSEINQLLADNSIKNAIEKNLFIRVRKLDAAFFSINDKQMEVSTGLLDKRGKLIDHCPDDRHSRNIRIGLHLEHQFIRHLINSKDPHRAYFALTFLSHKLAKCQRLLVPYTREFYFIEKNLSSDMRRGLIDSLLSPKSTHRKLA